LRVLYLSYTGLLEPLGQSQVFAYLRLLSRKHQITLVTFEKSADLDDDDRIRRQREACEEHGLRWIPMRYHHRPRLIATAWDMIAFTWTALREARRERVELLHCRSYVPSFVALAVKYSLGVPFIFDMRAFWPDEMVAAGRLRIHSPLFRLLKAAERLCVIQAAAVVSLTEAGIDHIRRLYSEAVADVQFTVIPTCVDLDRFLPRETPGPLPIRVGSLGSVTSGWFKFDWLVAFFAATAVRDPLSRFAIVTLEDGDRIADLVAGGNLPRDRVDIFGAQPADVPNIVAKMSAVPMFYDVGEASIGRSPTRLGEVLACGVPVVVNPGVGDVEAIVRDNRVGVVIADASPLAMLRGVDELINLLQDPSLAERCRKVAEEHYSLEHGAEAYAAIYEDIACRMAAGPNEVGES
jgi:glycosyltransferase involved in cell wall biosynthesis